MSAVETKLTKTRLPALYEAQLADLRARHAAGEITDASWYRSVTRVVNAAARAIRAAELGVSK